MRTATVFALCLICVAAAPPVPTTRPAPFVVFDNLFNQGKPDLTDAGLAGCNIVYSGHVWPGAEKGPDYGKLPDEAAYKRAVRSRTLRPGPVVLDFEGLSLSGNPAVARAHFDLFLTLVRWTREAALGHVVGFYGHGLFPEEPGRPFAAEAAKLAAAVDAFFPSMYTFDGNRDRWKARAQTLLRQAHAIAPGKPVYLYVWPQLHGGKHDVLPADQWTFEMETARDLGADGVVLWSSSGKMSPPWDEAAPWWTATKSFIAHR